jgi:hypothetical protein
MNQSITVVDAGSGTGILGAFALSLGASKCYFLEHNPNSLQLSKSLIDELGLSDKSIFMECDARNVELPEKYDLLISETLSSGFVQEDFVPIVRHLLQFSQPHALFIPESFKIELDELDDQKKQLNTQSFFFSTEHGFPDRLIKASPAATHLKWITDAELYGGTHLRTGDCVSFLNERITGVDEGHPIFELI